MQYSLYEPHGAYCIVLGARAARVWLRPCTDAPSQGRRMCVNTQPTAAPQHRLVPDAQRDAAALWLINSCTVKGPSQDAMSTLIAAGKAAGKRVVVAGCVPQVGDAHELCVYLKTHCVRHAGDGWRGACLRCGGRGHGRVDCGCVLGLCVRRSDGWLLLRARRWWWPGACRSWATHVREVCMCPAHCAPRRWVTAVGGQVVVAGGVPQVEG